MALCRPGELVNVHARQPNGGRSTDPDDYPPERTAWALRAPDRLVRHAVLTIGLLAGAIVALRLLERALFLPRAAPTEMAG